MRWIRLTSASNGQPHWINLEHFLDMRIVAYEDAQKRRLQKTRLYTGTIYIEVQELPEEILNRPAIAHQPPNPSRYEEPRSVGA